MMKANQNSSYSISKLGTVLAVAMVLLQSSVGYAQDRISSRSSYGHIHGTSHKHYPIFDIGSQRFELSPGESRTVYLPRGYRHVGKIFFDGYARSSDSMLSITVNGDEKFRAPVPKKDPPYVGYIGEATDCITFRNIARWGTIVISNTEAELSTRHFDDWRGEWDMGRDRGFDGGFSAYDPNFDSDGRFYHPDFDDPRIVSSEAMYLARKGFVLPRALRPHADPAKEYVKYLLPIRTVAGKARVGD